MTSQRLFSNGAALLVWAPKFSPPAQAQIWPDNSREVYDDQPEYGKAKNWPHMEDNSLPKPKRNIQKQNWAERQNE